MLRQLLLRVDECLCKDGWIEKFDSLCARSKEVVKEAYTLPISELTFEPLKEVAHVLFELNKRLYTADGNPDCDDEVSSSGTTSIKMSLSQGEVTSLQSSHGYPARKCGDGT